MMTQQILKREEAEENSDSPFLLNIGFVMTYRCPIACPHCILKAGPHRHEEMAREDILEWLGQASAYNGGQILSACFTGGEPFYDREKLEEASAHAASQGMISTVVTNGFWATSHDRAREILETLPDLKAISVSTDHHHLTQLPFEYVRNALLAAKERGLFYFANVCTENVNDPEYIQVRQWLEQIIGSERITTVITFPVGRAKQTIDTAAYEVTDIPPAGACTTASTPTVFPDGKVTACLGPVIDLCEPHPLLLGNVKEQLLKQILDRAEMNPVLHIIRLWGPVHLMTLLRERGYTGELPEHFVKGSICDLCYALMADSKIREALTDLAMDAELMKKVAYARVYYLNERRMIEMIETSGTL
jgi:MoaA/NifB/PqqE/SkfB family radical SAM enzyme